MTKASCRQFFQKKRNAITPKEQLIWDDLIVIQFQKIPLPPLHTVFTYAAIENKKEINTEPILDFLKFRNPGMQVCYPVSNFSTSIINVYYVNTDTIFKTNKFGISEPEPENICMPSEIDLILVPLLAFDEHGYRVGYGKGMYDRFLPSTRDGAIKIGLSYFEPIKEIVDINEYDVSLNYCITPQRVYEF